MFPKNCWYVGAMAHEVGRHLLPRTILENAVVFFRRVDGSVAALADRCSHRKVSLSLGRLIGDDVQCGYHGLTFAGDGSCTSIPGQTRIPPKACVRSYPVIERDGYVWIWPGDPDQADETCVPDYADICSSKQFAGLPAKILVVQAPCAFNIENVLDLSHVSYVHQDTVGTPEVAHTRPTTKIDASRIEVSRDWESIPSGPSFKRLFGWDNVKRSQRIIFWPGGNIRLEIDVEPVGNTDPSQRKRIRVAGPCTPSTSVTHYKFSAMYRDFAHDDDALTTGMAEQFRKTILEDQALMEDQQRNWSQDGIAVLESMSPSSSGGMFDLAVDQAPLAARRMLQQLAAKERSAMAEAAPASLVA